MALAQAATQALKRRMRAWRLCIRPVLAILSNSCFVWTWVSRCSAVCAAQHSLSLARTLGYRQQSRFCWFVTLSITQSCLRCWLAYFHASCRSTFMRHSDHFWLEDDLTRPFSRPFLLLLSPRLPRRIIVCSFLLLSDVG